jgi:hypothetical protein
VVIVEPGILGPMHGSVVVDLVEAGHEPKPDPYFPQRQIFSRGERPSVVITIARDDQIVPVLRWPDDFHAPPRADRTKKSEPAANNEQQRRGHAGGDRQSAADARSRLFPCET